MYYGNPSESQVLISFNYYLVSVLELEWYCLLRSSKKAQKTLQKHFRNLSSIVNMMKEQHEGATCHYSHIVTCLKSSKSPTHIDIFSLDLLIVFNTYIYYHLWSLHLILFICVLILSACTDDTYKFFMLYHRWFIIIDHRQKNYRYPIIFYAYTQ